MGETLSTSVRQPLLTGLARSGQYGALDPASQASGPQATASTGQAPSTSPLSNSVVGLRQLPLDDDAAPQQVASLARLQTAKPNIGQKALSVLMTIGASGFKLTGAVLGTAGGLLIGGVAKLATLAKEAMFGVSQAKLDRAAMHDAFRTTDPQTSVLDKAVLVKTPGGQPGQTTPVATLMEAYRVQLGGDSRISSDDMKMYIEMGQRVVEGLQNSPTGQPPLTISKGGQTFQVQSNLDTTRAISWYLQAKAVADNAHKPSETVTREAATLKSGAMIGSDPGNKLYTFLASADNAYGRCSTHCQERSATVDTSWLGGARALFNGGIAAVFSAGVSGQPLQRGIEDFDKKMPSMGGTLLFDRLTGPGGQPEIYMKWESVGMPNSFGFTGKHADDADGFADKMLNRGFAMARCVGHSVNFIGNADPGAMYRGEKMDKGDARLLFDRFKTAVDTSGLPKKEADMITKEVKTYGAYRMDERLDNMIQQKQQALQGASGGAATAINKQIGDLQAIKTDLATFCGKMGATDLGIARKGGEVHVAVG